MDMTIKNYHGNKALRKDRHVFPKSQAGSVLLIFVLLLIIGSSYFLVIKLNTSLAKTRQDEQTRIALSAARNALIGYAITFPDRDTSGVVDGPGYLPCPDLDNDGSASANCSLGGGTTIGRLPNKTLRLEELRDASGQRLWYALSANFRFGSYKTIPLNSESPTSAELSVNGVGDIVAVIISPGSPVDGQDRDPSETAIANEITHYLEGDNNDRDISYITTLGDSIRQDGEYDANDNHTFNDRLVFITRQELMQAVEKRVLGEVKQTLLNYQTGNNNAFPWLSPFANPESSNYLWTASTREGHLPLSIPQQVYDNNAAFTATWNALTGGVFTMSGMAPLDDCLRNSSCTSQNNAFDASPLIVNAGNAMCTWVNRFSFNCSTTINDIWPVLLPGVNRTYTLAYTDDSTNNGAMPSLTPASPTSSSLPRTRRLSINGTIRGQLRITVQDTGAQVGEAELINVDSGMIELTGMDYHLDAVAIDLNGDGDVRDAGEQGDLPDWFFVNNWHRLIYIAYSSGGGATCTVGTDCLTLAGGGAPANNKRALIISAGSALATQDRTSGNIGNYYENENNTPGDDTFQTGDITGIFNDQIRIIDTSP